MKLVFEHLVKENKAAFLQKVIAVAKRLDINPNWLMLVMQMESNINHKAVNPMGGATGLIQFMPFVARELGTSSSALLAMSNVEQLDYVELYFKRFKNYITSFTDLYLITFYPFALTHKKPDSWNFPDIVYRYNKALDKNGDRIINLGEFKRYILSKVPKSFPLSELSASKKNDLPS
jgi:Transglycosylase SLT domain